MPGERGLLWGTRGDRWKTFTPKLDVWFGTTPTMGPAVVYGRYLREPNRVRADIQILPGTVGAGFNPGAGTYCIRLPVPCKPNVGGKQSAGADRTLGYGNINRLVGLSNEQPLTLITALASDFPGQTFQGRARDWLTMWCPRVYARGTGTVPITAASLAVAFPFTLPFAPNAEDITVAFTSNPSTIIEGAGTLNSTALAVTFATPLTFTPTASDINVQFTANQTATTFRGIWLTGISSSGFTINCVAAPATSASFTYTVHGPGMTPWITGISTAGFTLNLGSAPATAATFTYKVDTPKSLLVASNAPVNFGAGAGALDSLFLSLDYEPDVR